jgi:hypothetical protein
MAAINKYNFLRWFKTFTSATTEGGTTASTAQTNWSDSFDTYDEEAWSVNGSDVSVTVETGKILVAVTNPGGEKGLKGPIISLVTPNSYQKVTYTIVVSSITGTWNSDLFINGGSNLILNENISKTGTITSTITLPISGWPSSTYPLTAVQLIFYATSGVDNVATIEIESVSVTVEYDVSTTTEGGTTYTENSTKDLTEDSLPHYMPSEVSKSMPIFVAGETTAFYINSLVDLISTDNLELWLINAETLSKIQQITSGILYAQEYSEGYNYYMSFTNPVMNTGIYRLALIYHTSSGYVMCYISTPIFYDTRNYSDYSMRIKFRHSTNIFGFGYGVLSGFYQQFRIAMVEVDNQVNSDIDQYKSTTTGKYRNYYDQSMKYRKFETLYFDEKMHDAMFVLNEHEEIYINSVKYGLKTAYKVDIDNMSRVSKGNMELWDESFIDEKNTTLTDIS